MKKVLFLSTIVLIGLSLSACGNKQEAEESSTEIAGPLTVVTNRPDAEELYQEMTADFQAKYPEVTEINWESTGTDYDEYIMTRMNTTDYGDVLFVPFTMAATPAEYEKYFVSFGTIDELETQYLDVTEADNDNQVYGIPTVLNSLGILYNQTIFDQAGITTLPSSSEEFIEAAKQIKEKTDAVPFYSNYQALAVWAGALSSYGGEDFKAETLAAGTAFQPGQPLREVMDLFYDLSTNGLIEEDPITLDSQKAQQQLANGEVAMLMNGSQMLAPIQGLATEDTIKMMPFPTTINGKSSLALGAPSVIGINKNTENLATAQAFVEFFLSPESGFAEDMGGMTPVKSAFTAEEETLISENNVILTAPATDAKTETTYSNVANEVGIGRLTDVLQEVINIGLYPEQNISYQELIDELEAKWAAALKEYE